MTDEERARTNALAADRMRRWRAEQRAKKAAEQTKLTRKVTIPASRDAELTRLVAGWWKAEG